MFEHQFRHEIVGLETKLFWLPLAQQISFMSSTSLINLSDERPFSIIAFSGSVPLAQIAGHFFYCKMN